MLEQTTTANKDDNKVNQPVLEAVIKGRQKKTVKAGKTVTLKKGKTLQLNTYGQRSNRQRTLSTQLQTRRL
ncbi:MAG: hypothetical protein ACLUR5_08280 [Eubacterium ventriosum]